MYFVVLLMDEKMVDVEGWNLKGFVADAKLFTFNAVYEYLQYLILFDHAIPMNHKHVIFVPIGGN